MDTYAHEWPDALDRTRTPVDTVGAGPRRRSGAGDRVPDVYMREYRSERPRARNPGSDGDRT